MPLWLKILFGSIAAFGILFGNGLLSSLASDYVNQKVMKAKITTIETSIQKTDDTLDTMNATLHEHDKAITVHETQLQNMDEKLDDIGEDVKFLVRQSISSNP